MKGKTHNLKDNEVKEDAVYGKYKSKMHILSAMSFTMLLWFLLIRSRTLKKNIVASEATKLIHL